MTISPKLKALLDKEKVPYQLLEHPLAYTAMEIAGAQHVPGRELAKSVLVKVDDRYILCVLPANPLHRSGQAATFSQSETGQA